MTDVFLSYANEDRDRAEMLAGALSASGWSVWWDRNIIIGQAFDQAIEHELETAKSVIVLWSKHSIASEWVRNEAAVAAERGVLIPAMIDDVRLPLEFRRKQTARLFDWTGDVSHRGFQALCEGVAATIGDPRPRPHPVREQKSRTGGRWAFAVTATIAVVLVVGIYTLGPWRTSTAPTPVAESDRAGAVAPTERRQPPGARGDLADLVIGSYYGDVIADSKGSSRSDIRLTITKLDALTVRVTSDYRRLGTVDVALTRIGNKIFNAGGGTPFILDLDQNPPTLIFDPRSEVAYRGSKEK